MEWFQFAFLGAVQGATEFIPVSSSAHLVLVPWLLGWSEPDLLFDTMVHWGTLAGVVAYFWRDILSLLGDWFATFSRRRIVTPEGRIAWLIVIGSVPAAVMGVLWEKSFEELFSSPAKVAVLLLGTGVILTAGEWLGQRKRGLDTLTVPDSLWIGIAQGIAIAPGISRSGITIAAGLLRGVRREEAARYSFLLGIPIILGAGLFQVYRTPVANLAAVWPSLAVGFVFAAVSGFLAVRFLLDYLRGHGLKVFAVYCWLFGGASLIIAAAR
ncbi:MAG: undecaprenyl-diphosphatase UppP [Chloroflexi bacterium]|nr:undecaprenyl-diphosphatase UppP [Chloroflexota bacterium]